LVIVREITYLTTTEKFNATLMAFYKRRAY